MKKMLLTLLLIAGALPLGCIRVYYNIAPEFSGDGVVNIDGRMDADDPRVTVTVDDVSVDWKELKTLVEKQMATLPKESKPRKASVSPPAVVPVAAAPPVSNAPGTDSPPRMTHSVQVGAFRQAENAEQQLAQLTAKGYPARLVRIVDSRGRAWHTVRIGDYPSSESAHAQAQEFKRRERMDSVVRPYGSL